MNLHQRTSFKSGLTAMLLLLLPAPLFAHVGAGSVQGVLHGFAHPLVGLDHMVAMVAVGLWAAQRGGRALWALPAVFVGGMVLAGAVGVQGLHLPGVEAGILASIVVLGALVAFAVRPSLALSAAAVGLFAIFHGHAHGAEMPRTVGAFAYALGFAGATLLLHAAGIALGLQAQQLTKTSRVAWVRATGGVICVVGAAYWFF